MGVYDTMYHRWREGSHVAIEIDDLSISYDDIHQRVLAWLDLFLELKLDHTTVIAVQLPKSLLLLEVILAGLAYGVPVLPLNDGYTKNEARFYLEDAQVSLFICMADVRQECPSMYTYTAEEIEEILKDRCFKGELPSVADDGLAMLLYTSGTTGKPKGAMISHGNILATVQGLHDAWEFSSQDRLLHMLPLFHVHGLFVAQFVALFAQCTSVWMYKFSKEDCIRLLEEKNISVMMAVPTLYFRLLQGDDRHSFPHLRLCTSGSAPLPVSLHEDFEARFGVRIVERYGMTEAGIVLSNPYRGERRAGTVGFPVSGAQLRIVDAAHRDCPRGQVGELWISGPSVVSGYLRRPEQTARSFTEHWLHSGDLASQDADGYIRIAGRAKDLVISGGYNIYPLEIESVFLTHPRVARAAGVGIPDPQWGERFVMVIIVKKDVEEKEGVKESWAPETLEHELRDFARMHLAAYKRPKAYVFVSQFPMNAMGKVQKSKIRSMLLDM